MKRTLRRYLGTVTGSKSMPGERENPWQPVGPFLPGTASMVVEFHYEPRPPKLSGPYIEDVAK